MSGRKALVGLSLLCALVFCAFGAASASAAGGTTAYTCDPEAKVKDFEDPHCDKSVGVGSFGHTAIAGTTKEIVATNSLTGLEDSSWKLKGLIAATPIEITCGSIHASSVEMTNNAAMSVTGQGKLAVEGCKLLKPESQVANCTVTVKASEEKSETINSKMEMKFSPLSGTIFTEIAIANATGKTCKGIAGPEFKVEGTASATGIGGEAATPNYSGATLKFDTAMTSKTLTFAGHEAELEGSLTFRMGPKAGEGNPIVLTTE